MWLLIIIYMNETYNNHIEFKEFKTREGCEKAKQFIRSEVERENSFGMVVGRKPIECIHDN